ncbi:MAG: hypothetical protein EBX41_03085 [Chitinophagia bacterium]|nr:hypothetical protein [Chitinophagia bacterium]
MLFHKNTPQFCGYGHVFISNLWCVKIFCIQFKKINVKNTPPLQHQFLKIIFSRLNNINNEL